MTSAGKMMMGALIMTAAFVTAKYLHRPTPVNDVPMSAPVPAAKLNWQVHPIVDPSAMALQPIATKSETSRSMPIARLTSGQEFTNTPAGAAYSGFAAAPSGARPPLPFAMDSKPAAASQLSEVDDEEVELNSDAQDFVQHTVQFGETLPQIAMQYTGRREAYMAIYQANLDVLTSPADVSPGIVLKIPVR